MIPALSRLLGYVQGAPYYRELGNAVRIELTNVCEQAPSADAVPLWARDLLQQSAASWPTTGDWILQAPGPMPRMPWLTPPMRIPLLAHEQIVDFYNPDQPRVPAGGPGGGEFGTDGGGALYSPIRKATAAARGLTPSKKVTDPSDKRMGAGQQTTTVIDPVTGERLTQTEFGKLGEHILEHVATTDPAIAAALGGRELEPLNNTHGYGSNAPLDFMAGSNGIECKAMNMDKDNPPKVGMKTPEITAKIEFRDLLGLDSISTVAVLVSPSANRIAFYAVGRLYNGRWNGFVDRGTHLGTYNLRTMQRVSETFTSSAGHHIQGSGRP